jgi:hypothetical protein
MGRSYELKSRRSNLNDCVPFRFTNLNDCVPFWP